MLADRLFEILQEEGTEGELADFLATVEERVDRALEARAS